MPPALSSTPARRAAVIKALAHPSRILIAESLLGGARCVCELRDIVGADLSTVSKHLLVMRRAGLLVSEKRGLNIFYRFACSCSCFGSFLRCVDQLASGSDPACS